MFFRDLKMKRGAVLNVTLVEVRLPVKLGHRDAGKLFAEPLKTRLAALGLGTVHGIAIRQRATGEVIGVELQLGLTDASRQALGTVAAILEALAAPLGSSIRVTGGTGKPMLFGKAEGLEVSVGTDEAPDAEARRELAMVCRDAIEDLAVNRGWTETDGRTRLFFYGEDAQAMKQNLSQLLTEHPRFGAARLRRLA